MMQYTEILLSTIMPGFHKLSHMQSDSWLQNYHICFLSLRNAVHVTSPVYTPLNGHEKASKTNYVATVNQVNFVYENIRHCD